ncbi:hypothetical protein BDW59DRAFT_147563 [Aspergillus cavernicola]|uniref:ENTH domain-containing protein n=1 Tax=Aspergillus cavernicola TaxID=176166 RepID=A0ABR4I9E7_9EURO
MLRNIAYHIRGFNSTQITVLAATTSDIEAPSQTQLNEIAKLTALSSDDFFYVTDTIIERIYLPDHRPRQAQMCVSRLASWSS